MFVKICKYSNFRTLTAIEGAFVEYSIKKMFYKSLPSLLNVDVKKCEGKDTNEEHVQVKKEDFIIFAHVIAFGFYICIFGLIFEIYYYGIT